MGKLWKSSARDLISAVGRPESQENQRRLQILEKLEITKKHLAEKAKEARKHIDIRSQFTSWNKDETTGLVFR
jgi:hypothetical protein